MKKKQYTNEFKAEAVRLAEQSKESTSQIARELRVPASVLCRWVREFGTKPDSTAAITPPNEHEELILLRRMHPSTGESEKYS